MTASHLNDCYTVLHVPYSDFPQENNNKNVLFSNDYKYINSKYFVIFGVVPEWKCWLTRLILKSTRSSSEQGPFDTVTVPLKASHKQVKDEDPDVFSHMTQYITSGFKCQKQLASQLQEKERKTQ